MKAPIWRSRAPGSPDAPYGVGLVLNGDGWFLIDLDDCRATDGKWTPEIEALFSSFGGALGEISTSNNGLHILGRCDPSKLQDRRNKWDGNKEFYTDKRFVALSQKGLEPIGGSFTDQDWTDQLLRIVPQRELLGDLPDGQDPSYTGPEDDDQLIAKMLASTGSAAAAFGIKAKIADLWNANKTVLSKH